MILSNVWELQHNMFPIALNLAVVPILLIGEGEAFEKRKKQLMEGGAKHLTCHSCESGNLAFTIKELDSPLRGNERIVMIVGLDYSTSEMIANAARTHGKLVNVEDVPELCDFYFTSFVQRGDLTIAVSTNGASPTLASRVREYIAKRFGVEWEGYASEIKQHRLQLKSQGKGMKEVRAESEKFLDEKGWLSCVRCPKEAS